MKLNHVVITSHDGNDTALVFDAISRTEQAALSKLI
jgi:hypothetical protein